MRQIWIDANISPGRNSWQIFIESEDGKEITAQEILDAFSDFLLEEGEINPYDQIGNSFDS